MKYNKKIKVLKQISGITGWNIVKTALKLKHANKQGVSVKAYLDFHAYNMDEVELIELADTIKAKKIRDKLQKERLIGLVCDKTGWDKDTTVAEMNKALKKGISYFEYVKNECWKKDDADMLKLVKWWEKEKSRRSKSVNGFLERICEDTGWDEMKVRIEVDKAKANCGASYEDFFLFKLHEKDEVAQREYLTFDTFSMLKMKYNDYGRQDLFNDKAAFNELFSDQIKRNWFVNRNLKFDDFVEETNNMQKLFVKPLRGTHGRGTEIIDCSDDLEAKRTLYKKIISEPPKIFEDVIVQHKKLSELCPTSVNTVRIVSIYIDGTCNYICAGLRMGRDKIVDNFHAGGIIAGIDTETGLVTTNAVDYNRNVYETHPVTGIRIKGFQIPNWNKLLEACEAVTGRVEGINLVGWDFAITEDGVDLIEGNTGPSFVMQQLPFAMENIGIKNVVERFI